MTEWVNLVFRFISYKLFVRHKYGHGIHSPFVYGFVKNVLINNEPSQDIIDIEYKRREYLRSNRVIEIIDYGAGSKSSQKKKRTLRSIVRTSSVNRKYGSMLYRLVKYYNPETIIELGTSAGISSLYLAAANPQTKVFSIEGNKSISNIASETFQDLSVKNIELITDTFENAFEGLLQKCKGKLMLFIDGNHTREAVLGYVELCSRYAGECLIAIDDINWSNGMHEAWEKLKLNTEVKISVDLFYMGIILMGEKFLKQNFVITF